MSEQVAPKTYLDGLQKSLDILRSWLENSNVSNEGRMALQAAGADIEFEISRVATESPAHASTGGR